VADKHNKPKGRRGPRKPRNARKPKPKPARRRVARTTPKMQVPRPVALRPGITRNVATRGGASHMTLSKCALHYALAIADPWADSALGACVPISAGMTWKMAGFIRGQTTTSSTTGYGWILAMPSVANDMASLLYTDAGFGLSRLDVAAALNTLNPGVNRAYVNNLAYSSSSLIPLIPGASGGQVVQARIVAASLRLWYTGTTLNMAGTTHCFRDPQHASVQSISQPPFVQDITSWGTRRETDLANFTRSLCHVTDFAVNQSEQELVGFSQEEKGNIPTSHTTVLYPFSRGDSNYLSPLGVGITLADPASTGGYNNAVPTMGVQFIGAPGQSVNFEYIVHVEYSGAQATANATSTDSDPEGTQKVMSAAARLPIMSQNAKKEQAWPKMYRALTHVAAAAAKIVVPAAAPIVDLILAA